MNYLESGVIEQAEWCVLASKPSSEQIERLIFKIDDIGKTSDVLQDAK